MKQKYLLSLSYGKDSLACLEAISRLKLPLDKIIHVDVWATDNILADLPEMINFKDKIDHMIEEKYHLKVEHICAIRNGEKLTYEKQFYSKFVRGKNKGRIYGFPFQKGPWCMASLKRGIAHSKEYDDYIQYIGIAVDEPERIKENEKIRYPLVELGWTEQDCYNWCKDNDLLAPIYDYSNRGGCWFCHNQTIDQLRMLRKNYRYLWEILLKWDKDSPVAFRTDKRSLLEYDRRFFLEDKGLVPKDRKFRWKMLEELDKKKWVSCKDSMPSLNKKEDRFESSLLLFLKDNDDKIYVGYFINKDNQTFWETQDKKKVDNKEVVFWYSIDFLI